MNLGKQEVKAVAAEMETQQKTRALVMSSLPHGFSVIKPALQIPCFLRKVQPQRTEGLESGGSYHMTRGRSQWVTGVGVTVL